MLPPSSPGAPSPVSPYEIRVPAGASSVRLYNTEEAAAYCKMGLSAFKQWVMKGHVKPDVNQPRANLYSQDNLDRFKRSERRGPGYNGAKSAPRLGKSVERVIRALRSLGRPATAPEILAAIETAGEAMRLESLYATLHRMERRALLRKSAAPSAPEGVAGRPPHVYALTPEAEALLARK